MSILDRTDDGTFTYLLNGDGYSLIAENGGQRRVRYDVWADGVTRCVPLMLIDERSASDYADMAIQKLRGDAERLPCLIPAVERLAAALAAP